MSLLDRFRRTPAADALYRRVVAIARQPDWYLAGEVPDTVDGRFDMVAMVLTLVLLRLEAEDEAQRAADVTERFINDMDGSLRQMGIGDQNVGKHVGRMVSALGGRLGAYRDALAGDAPPAALEEALRRNVYRGNAVGADAVDWLATRVRTLAAAIAATPLAALSSGEIAA